MKKVLLVCATLGLGAAGLRADIVQNGTFTNITNPGTQNFFAGLYTGYTLASWTPATNGSAPYLAALLYAPGTTIQGTVGNAVILNSDGVSTVTLSQTMNTVVGQKYTIDFSLTAESALLGDGSYTGYPNPVPTAAASEVQVTVANSGSLSFITQGLRQQSVAGWNSESITFTAQSTSTVLTFQDVTPQAGAAYSPAISDIYATPEPAFYGALAVGLAGLAFAVIRRNSAAKS